MPGTLSGDTSRNTPRLSPVLIHVASYDHLMSAPLGLFSVSDALVVGRREGRAMPGQLLLDDPRVSLRHCVLERTIRGVVATDLSSSNGTWVNGEQLEGPTVLNDGDLIEVGRSLLCFRVLSKPPERDGWNWGPGKTFCPELGTLSAQLSRLAASSEALLLMGETGTGKEIAARHVHAMSMRSGPLIAVDCGALPEQLVESTLFGHDKGAFTGATEARVGDIVRADRGTLFLDELGNLSPSAQAKLLRVLETKMVRPVGGRDSTRVDVRFVAATNAELDDAEFRSDLRFRLSGFVARLPALRKRKEDLGLLIRSLLSESGVIRARISRSAAQKLVSHSFPGNIRQLRGVLRSAAVLHAKDGALDIDVEALDMLDARAPHPHEAASTPLVSTRGKAPDRDALQAALIASRGNVAAAARDLRTSARQLYRWLAREDIDPETFRPSEHREPSAG